MAMEYNILPRFTVGRYHKLIHVFIIEKPDIEKEIEWYSSADLRYHIDVPRYKDGQNVQGFSLPVK